MTRTMDPVFADGLRAALVHHVATSAAARKRRRWRRVIGMSLGIVVIGGGAAAAQGVIPLPGVDQVTTLGSSVTVTRTGTSTVDLGRRPAAATDVELTLKCLSAGTFSFAEGASMTCDATDAGKGVAGYALVLAPGQHSTTITASPGARWTLTARFSKHVPTGPATNARGQTYGVDGGRGGAPDLIAVMATNGKQGYAYASDLNGSAPANPSQALEWQRQDAGHSHTIPVYESDGTTKIGEFVIPGVAHSGRPAPQPQEPTRSP